jgi:hypothetical protein
MKITSILFSFAEPCKEEIKIKVKIGRMGDSQSQSLL